mgnify:CR=1 FL=1
MTQKRVGGIFVRQVAPIGSDPGDDGGAEPLHFRLVPREQPPTTVSGVPIDALYTPDSLNGFDPDAEKKSNGTTSHASANTRRS